MGTVDIHLNHDNFHRAALAVVASSPTPDVVYTTIYPPDLGPLLPRTASRRIPGLGLQLGRVGQSRRLRRRSGRRRGSRGDRPRLPRGSAVRAALSPREHLPAASRSSSGASSASPAASRPRSASPRSVQTLSTSLRPPPLPATVRSLRSRSPTTSHASNAPPSPPAASPTAAPTASPARSSTSPVSSTAGSAS